MLYWASILHDKLRTKIHWILCDFYNNVKKIWKRPWNNKNTHPVGIWRRCWIIILSKCHTPCGSACKQHFFHFLTLTKYLLFTQLSVLGLYYAQTINNHFACNLNRLCVWAFSWNRTCYIKATRSSIHQLKQCNFVLNIADAKRSHLNYVESLSVFYFLLLM